MKVLLAVKYQHAFTPANPRGVSEQQKGDYQGFLCCLNGDSGLSLTGQAVFFLGEG